MKKLKFRDVVDNLELIYILKLCKFVLNIMERNYKNIFSFWCVFGVWFNLFVWGISVFCLFVFIYIIGE